MTDPPIWKDEETSEDAGREHRRAGREAAEFVQFEQGLRAGLALGFAALTAADVGALMDNHELHKRTGAMNAKGLIVWTGHRGPCFFKEGGVNGKLWRQPTNPERITWAQTQRDGLADAGV